MRRALAVLIWLVLAGLVVQSDLVLPQQPQPPLDISGIAEIQSIPVGQLRAYRLNTTQGISMRKILDSIANLAVMQFDVEKFVIKAVNSYTKQEEEVIGGEFGRILRHEILGFNPQLERSLLVKHTEFVQTPGLTPRFDEDHFDLYINDREIELTLCRDMGKPEKGFEWGVGLLRLTRYVPNSGNPPKTEQLVLTLDYHKAIYIKRILAPDGTLLAGEKWEFVPGNPNPVSYSKFP